VEHIKVTFQLPYNWMDCKNSMGDTVTFPAENLSRLDASISQKLLRGKVASRDQGKQLGISCAQIIEGIPYV